MPLPNTSNLPANVAMTTTLNGVTVPFVVRLETGTMDRGIYQNAVLFDPTSDPAPTPFTPPKGWNSRLLAQHGSGCPGGWYIQGAAQGVNILTGNNLTRLGEGWGMFINTLQHPANSCNAIGGRRSDDDGQGALHRDVRRADLYALHGQLGRSHHERRCRQHVPGLVRRHPDLCCVPGYAVDSDERRGRASAGALLHRDQSGGIHPRSASRGVRLQGTAGLVRRRESIGTHRSGTGSRRHPRL